MACIDGGPPVNERPPIGTSRVTSSRIYVCYQGTDQRSGASMPRLALVGLGYWGRNLYRVLRERWEL